LSNEKESDLFSDLHMCFSNGFSSEEITSITEAFGKIVPTKRVHYAQDSYFPISESELSLIVQNPVVIFLIGFAIGSIAEGFFKAIGSDLYKEAKEKLKKAFKDKPEPKIGFIMFHNEVRIEISAEPKNEKELNAVFDTINEARKMAISEIDSSQAQVNMITVRYEGYWNLEKS
jgi:transcriptional antiterminator